MDMTDDDDDDDDRYDRWIDSWLIKYYYVTSLVSEW